jgi:hypothetical protein
MLKYAFGFITSISIFEFLFLYLYFPETEN